MEDMDLVSFNALLESSIRINANQKVEDAWTRFVAAQGTGKALEKWTKHWKKQMKHGIPDARGANEFIRKFGKGI